MGLFLPTKKSASYSFEVYSGAGNRFLIFDGREEIFKDSLAPNFCEASRTDGILILTNSSVADFGMKIINADGSYAEMCGNGLRCLIHYLSIQIPQQSYTIKTLAGIYRGGVSNFSIWTEFLPPTHVQKHLPITLQGNLWEASFINIGVPHLVLFLDEGPFLNLEEAFIEANLRKDLFSNGVNLNGIRRKKEGFFSIRTIERGVGRETLACGTGTMASALSLALRFDWTSPMRAEVASQDFLDISFERQGNFFHSLMLSGPAQRERTLYFERPSK